MRETLGMASSVESDHHQRLMVEYSRVGLFVVILSIAIVAYLFQPGFINYQLLKVYYITVMLGLGSHLFIIQSLDKMSLHKIFIFGSFVLDALLIAFLIYHSGAQQSLFLVFNLINILICGYVFRFSGAFMLALITSILLSVIVISGPEVKSLSMILMLALSNLAFFSIAGLSGYLSEQLATTETQLKNIEQVSQVIMDNMPSGVIGCTHDGKIIQCNPMAEKILNTSALINKNINQFFSFSKDKKTEVKYLNQVLSVTSRHVYSPVLEEDLNIVVFDDVTQVKQLEAKLRQSEKLAAVGGLAAGIAHEIRNPLASISGSIEMLSRSTPTEEDQKLMKIVLKEIDRLNNLVGEFLDYAKPSQLPSEKINLSFILSEVMEVIKNDSHLRRDLRYQIEIDSDIYIIGNSEKIKQAFLNIIINACQAMKDTPVADLTILLKNNQEKIVLKIKDTGAGMSEETQKKIFEPFYTTKPKGTGLGLAITYKILENHSVQTFVSSKLGEGTEFVLTFSPIKK